MIPIDRRMKAVWQILKKHPVAFIVFLLYTLLCFNTLRVLSQFRERLRHRQPDESGIMLGGESAQWSAVFLVLIAAIFFFITAGFLIANKTERKFYLWLGLIIVLETVATLNINW